MTACTQTLSSVVSCRSGRTACPLQTLHCRPSVHTGVVPQRRSPVTVRPSPTTPGSSRRQGARGMRATKTDLEAFVWAVDGQEVACPLCESLRLILNEKQLSYDRSQVDYGNKPEWLQQAGDDMPVLKYVPDGSLHSGLINITNFLEDKYPEPSIGKTGSGQGPSVTKEADYTGVWEAFKSAQKSGDNGQVAQQLESLNKEIQAKVGTKYFGQEYPDITDLVLGPRLHHIEVVLKKSGDWPSGLEATEQYLGNIRNLAGWAPVKPTDEDVEAFWKQHAGKC